LVLLETGHPESALVRCRQAMDFFESAGLDRRVVLCRLLLARIEQATGRLPEAREYCRVALDKLTGIEAPLLRFHAHLLAGDLHCASGKSQTGYHSYRNASRELEGLRGKIQGEELKIAFMKNKLDV
jgi:ATP/maltotriose-dependent transcriptional regulator MalT